MRRARVRAALGTKPQWRRLPSTERCRDTGKSEYARSTRSAAIAATGQDSDCGRRDSDHCVPDSYRIFCRFEVFKAGQRLPPYPGCCRTGLIRRTDNPFAVVARIVIRLLVAGNDGAGPGVFQGIGKTRSKIGNSGRAGWRAKLGGLRRTTGATRAWAGQAQGLTTILHRGWQHGMQRREVVRECEATTTRHWRHGRLIVGRTRNCQY